MKDSSALADRHNIFQHKKDEWLNDFPSKDELNNRHWFVYVNDQLRAVMNGMWGRPPADPGDKTMRYFNDNQRAFTRINRLLRAIEVGGPIRQERDHYKYDKNNDLYHCHVSTSGIGKAALVVIWEADLDKHVVNIVNIDTHENIKFKRKGKKEDTIAVAIEVKNARLQEGLCLYK